MILLNAGFFTWKSRCILQAKKKETTSHFSRFLPILAFQGDAQVAAGLLVALLQFERHGAGVRQPQGQGGQRLAHGQGIVPRLQQALVLGTPPAAGDGVERRRLGTEGGVALAHEVQHVRVEVERAHCHQIDNGDGDPLLQQGRTLPREEAAVFGPVLVGRSRAGTIYLPANLRSIEAVP